jgi:hypothetical protein
MVSISASEASGLLIKPDVAAKRFHGSVRLDATRVGRDAGRIADEVILT